MTSDCRVENHIPSCIPRIVPTTGRPQTNPCQPSPCGPNSQCKNVNKQAVCSCLPTYMGTPPNCKPECIVNSECPPDQACVNQKCSDPCPNTCGLRAHCYTKNHSPICACPPGYTGDPFHKCTPQSKYNKYLACRSILYLRKCNSSANTILYFC